MNQSEARKQCFLASDWLKFGTLPRKHRAQLISTSLTFIPPYPISTQYITQYITHHTYAHTCKYKYSPEKSPSLRTLFRLILSIIVNFLVAGIDNFTPPGKEFLPISLEPTFLDKSVLSLLPEKLGLLISLSELPLGFSELPLRESELPLGVSELRLICVGSVSDLSRGLQKWVVSGDSSGCVWRVLLRFSGLLLVVSRRFVMEGW